MKKYFYAVVASALAFSGSASAALDVAVGTALSGVQTDVLELQGLVLPIVVTLAAGAVIIALVGGWVKKAGRSGR